MKCAPNCQCRKHLPHKPGCGCASCVHTPEKFAKVSYGNKVAIAAKRRAGIPVNQNAAKTQCANGHPFIGRNKWGQRICKPCNGSPKRWREQKCNS